jgi:hypothetical protein
MRNTQHASTQLTEVARPPHNRRRGNFAASAIAQGFGG